MTDIDIFDVREHIDSMIDAGERTATINRKKAVLSSVYKLHLAEAMSMKILFVASSLITTQNTEIVS